VQLYALLVHEDLVALKKGAGSEYQGGESRKGVIRWVFTFIREKSERKKERKKRPSSGHKQ